MKIRLFSEWLRVAVPLNVSTNNAFITIYSWKAPFRSVYKPNERWKCNSFDSSPHLWQPNPISLRKPKFWPDTHEWQIWVVWGVLPILLCGYLMEVIFIICQGLFVYLIAFCNQWGYTPHLGTTSYITVGWRIITIKWTYFFSFSCEESLPKISFTI